MAFDKVALILYQQGLNCIDKDLIREKSENDLLKQQPHSPARVIPLPYAPLNINTKDEHKENKKAAPFASGEQDPQGCSSRKAIPLPFNLKPNHSASGDTSSASSQVGTANGIKSTPTEKAKSSASSSSLPEEWIRSSTAKEESSQEKSWHFRAKFRLLRKASITYFVLAKEFFEIKKYGHTLRHLRYAMHCFGNMNINFIHTINHLNLRLAAWYIKFLVKFIKFQFQRHTMKKKKKENNFILSYILSQWVSI